jgi:hypothetical protein
LILEKSRLTVGERWTGTGRCVLIAARLVRMLLAHVEEFGTAEDGRLFADERGGVVASTTYRRVRNEARHLALTP